MADQNFRVKNGLTVGVGGSVITTLTDGNVGLGSTNPTSKLWVDGDGYFTGILTANRIFSSTYGEFVGGSIIGSDIVGTALSISGISTFANGPVFIGSGTSTGTALQILQVTGGAYISSNLGIGTTTPTSKLWVDGDGYFTGILTANRIFSSTYGEFVGGSISGTDLVGTALSISGISTLGTVKISAGIVSSTTGTAVTFIGNLTGTASYASTAGIATNLADGSAGNILYQSSPNTTAFVTNGTSGQVLLSDGSGTPYWGNVSAASGSFGGITVRDENQLVGTSGSVTALNFVGSNIVATATTGPNGIATITIADNLVGTALSISGISTLGAVKISSGIVTSNIVGTSVTFYGDFVGTASSAGYATTAFSLNGTSEGNLSVAYASTAGIASAVQPNSVALGSDTTGDYVQSISGTSNQITVSATSGEGSTPTLSIPNQFTVPQDLTVLRDVQIDRNLNVDGNITIGGTSAYILAESFRVSDADIILGFRTDAFGNDASNDTTANHGGIAVASTEGSPLINLTVVGIETFPATYKKIMWFKAGTFAGLGTDAWLSNYAIGIGSTQFPSGTRLAAGSVQFTENDLAVVRNINASGIITANKFSGQLDVTSALAQSVGFATTAINLDGGAQGSLPYQNASGITSFLSGASVNNKVLLYDLGNNKPYWGDVSGGSGAFGGITVRDEGTNSLSNIVTVDIFGSNISATSGGTGIASIRVNDNLVGTALSISGISTLGTVSISSGIISSTTGTAVTFIGNLTGTASYATTSGISTNVIGGIASVTSLFVNTTGISTLGTVKISAGIITSNIVGTSVTYYGDFVGTASSAGYATTAFNLDANGASNLNVAYASTAGIATYTSEWILGANGASDYTFTGPGFTGAENDPVLYLVRGQQYKFTNTMGMHPFRIQSTVNGSVGTQYNDGVTNNDVSNGTLTWDVQFDAPNLLYYQCTAHGGMGGKIYIIDAGIGPDISINTTGIITANSFRGDGSQLTGLTAGVSISTNTTNQAQYLTYVTGTGSTTGFGVTTTGLVFNPSTNNLGIGTTNPTSKLTVNGNVSITGVTTSGIIRISSSIVSPNDTKPVATLEAVGASTDYDIAIIPKGTGAIVASIPDGTSTGGNKRGDDAVDFQLSRSSATQVASGANSFIGGGSNNTTAGTGAVVCGGETNNTGVFSYSAIVGGQNNINNGGGYSFIGGGYNNTSQTDYVVIGGGNVNTASGQYSSVLGGSNNKAESTYSSVLGGYYNYAKRSYSSVIGGYGANTRNTYGAVAFAGANTTFGTGEGAGKQQARFVILSKATTDATPSTLTANGGTYDGDNVLDISSATAYLVKGSVIAFAAFGDTRAWEFTAVIKRQYSSASLVGTPIINDIAYDSGASGWNLSITADASTNSLKVEVTGQASTAIRWVTKIDSTEVAF